MTHTTEKGKHTSGPWRLTVQRKGPNSGFFIDHDIDSEDGYTILASYGEVDDTDEANARLIAAAPELVQALLNLQRELHSAVKLDVRKHYSLMVADSMASKAIGKAEGKV